MGFPPSLALAHAAGWDVLRRRALSVALRSIWLALALVGAGVLLGIPLIFQPEPSQVLAFEEVLGIVAVVLAWTYGLVCGAMTAVGGIGHTLPFLIRDFRLALWAAGAVVLAELGTTKLPPRFWIDATGSLFSFA